MSRAAAAPRLCIAGISGDSGKTLVSLALLAAARARSVDARAFKKGPDYIDAAWLSWAAAEPARHLDTWLMGRERAVATFARHAGGELNLVEGNRGLFDGVDAQGTHSTAELAKALRAPVILCVNVTKMTRTAAALVAGCKALDRELNIAGAVVNRVNGARHERVLREAIESACGVPVLGVIPKLPEAALLPERHLGLVTPDEHPAKEQLERTLLETGRRNLDIGRLLAIARSAPPLDVPPAEDPELPDGRGLRIAYLRDSAFTFYYRENLEALEKSGAGLVPVSALAAGALPDGIDALYIGGGFPETHAPALAANASFLASLRGRAAAGLPVYAECGGLMLLARGLHWRGERFPMAGVFPLDVEVCATPQGHGYAEIRVEGENPFYPAGAVLRGHEFHYSRIVIPGAEVPATACAVTRGTGCFNRRDAIVTANVWASYTHVHAAATPQWAPGLIGAARRFAGDRGAAFSRTSEESWAN